MLQPYVICDDGKCNVTIVDMPPDGRIALAWGLLSQLNMILEKTRYVFYGGVRRLRFADQMFPTQFDLLELFMH